jgi:hypothetical protein
MGLDENGLRQADADASEREADTEPHAATGTDVPNHLGPEADSAAPCPRKRRPSGARGSTARTARARP